MSSRLAHYNRTFLNPKGIGLVEASVEVYKGSHKGKPYTNIDATFTVGDCHRVVTLDLNVGNEKELNRMLKKIHKLEMACVRLRAAIYHEAKKAGFVKP